MHNYLINPPEWWLNLPDLLCGIILALIVTSVLFSPFLLLLKTIWDISKTFERLPSIENEKSRIKNWFIEYCSHFKYNELLKDRTELKEKHSLNVAQDSKCIAESISWADKNLIDIAYIAYLCGLLHDIGRFEQFKQYKTFKDFDSIDHANLGVKVLKKLNILKNFDRKTKNIIYCAIKWHNKIKVNWWKIFWNKKKKACVFLTRDADKLAIYQDTVAHLENPDKLDSYNHSSAINHKILLHAIQKKQLKNKMIKTFNDYIVMLFVWPYNIKYSKSLELIYKRKYINKLYESIQFEDIEIALIVDSIKQKCINFLEANLLKETLKKYENSSN